MNRFKSIAVSITAISVLLLAACAANDHRDNMRLDPHTVTIPDYRNFLTSLDQAIEQNEPRELNEDERERFDRISDRIETLLDEHDAMDELDQDQRRQFVNLHSELQSVVIGKDEDQILCRRQKQVGTHFRTTKCRRVSEWREMQQDAQDFLHRSYRSNVSGPQTQ